jgi:hypothetical protein
MAQPSPGTGATRTETPPPAPEHASTAQLLGDPTDQVTRLVQDEVRLAQAEVTGRAERLGTGAGLFGGAGLVAVLGLNALITAAVLGLPPLPTESIESVRTDVATVKERVQR